jgi:protein-L-isoaspartate(D-aspartate) O-methyltransferase
MWRGSIRWPRPAALLLGGALAAGLCLASGVRAQVENQDSEKARAHMVIMVQIETLLSSETTGIEELDPRILEAMSDVPRHAFVPEGLRDFAYGNHPLPVGHDQNLAAPFLVALMTHLAHIEPDDVVFETGTGAGYHAAVLSLLAAEVYSVEVVEPLAETAARTLRELGYDRVHAKSGDGYYGWRAQAPFDVIIVKEAVDHVPAPLIDQLKQGGRMVIPLGGEPGPQYLTVVEKAADGSLKKRRVLPVRFSVLQGGERT